MPCYADAAAFDADYFDFHFSISLLRYIYFRFSFAAATCHAIISLHNNRMSWSRRLRYICQTRVYRIR